MRSSFWVRKFRSIVQFGGFSSVFRNSHRGPGQQPRPFFPSVPPMYRAGGYQEQGKAEEGKLEGGGRSNSGAVDTQSRSPAGSEETPCWQSINSIKNDQIRRTFRCEGER